MPTDPEGEVHVVLTPESIDALARIPEMRVWEVGPTMVRGSKGKSIKRSCVSTVTAKTTNRRHAQKVKKADKKSARLRVRKMKKKNVVVDGFGLCDADFR